MAFLLWALDPDDTARLATPFFHAAAAAAMDYEVEVYFTARSVLLLEPGSASALFAVQGGKPIYDYMREAVAHGAKLLACSDALHAQGLDRSALIPECAGHGGAVQFMARVTDPAWRTLVF